MLKLKKKDKLGAIVCPQQGVENNFGERISTIKDYTTATELMVLNLLLFQYESGKAISKDDLYDIGVGRPKSVIASLRALGVVIKTRYIAEWINPCKFNFWTTYEFVGVLK